MWKKSDRKNFFWLGIERDFGELLERLYEAEAEESSVLYLLMMHLENKDDLSVFNTEEHSEVLELLSGLTEQTRKHHRMLSRITKLLSDFKKGMHRV